MKKKNPKVDCVPTECLTVVKNNDSQCNQSRKDDSEILDFKGKAAQTKLLKSVACVTPVLWTGVTSCNMNFRPDDILLLFLLTKCSS